VSQFSYFWSKVLKVKFFEFLALHDYSEGLMIVVTLIAFIFSVRHYGRHRALRIVPYYFALFLLAGGLEFYRYISPRVDPFADTIDTLGAAVLTAFEFCVFSLLILHYIAGAGRRLALKLNTGVFFIAEIFLYLRAFPRNPVHSMCVLETVGLLLPCGFYFYELFTNMNTKALKDRPSFWIVTGIIYETLYNACLMASLVYMGRFSEGAYAFAILFYCILFVFFMRAYKCPPEDRVVA
jgi:hypothetical protein